MVEDLLKGCMIGFSIAMPVGPIGLLCIKNSLARGMIYGVISGVGAACADTLYGALGGFGVSAVGNVLEEYRLALELFGGIFLCYLGVVTIFEKVANASESPSEASRFNVFFTTFLLTLTNPMTFLSFVGIYAGLGVGASSKNFLAPFLITFGVFIGSLLWWILLSGGSSIFKEKIKEQARKWLNRVSGSIILGFGIFALLSFIL